MASSSLTVICITDELERWMEKLQKQWSLEALVYDEGIDEGRLSLEPEEPKLDRSPRAVYLFPPATRPRHPVRMNDIKPRDWGWIDVRPGTLFEAQKRRLLLTSEVHGEDFAHEPVHPARFVEWLKRNLRKEKVLTFGVAGRNRVTGGQSIYRDIGYTQEALRLHKQGVEWAQLESGRVTFDPLTEM